MKENIEELIGRWIAIDHSSIEKGMVDEHNAVVNSLYEQGITIYQPIGQNYTAFIDKPNKTHYIRQR